MAAHLQSGLSLCAAVILLHRSTLGSVEASPTFGEAGALCIARTSLLADKPKLWWGRCIQSCTSVPRAAPGAGMHVLCISACSQPKVRWGEVKQSGSSHTGSKTSARIDEALQVEITDMHHDKGDSVTTPQLPSTCEVASMKPVPWMWGGAACATKQWETCPQCQEAGSWAQVGHLGKRWEGVCV